MHAFASSPDREPGREHSIPDEDTETTEVSGGRSETEVLLAITDLIVVGGPLPDLFHKLAPLVRELLNCDAVTFALCDSKRSDVVTHFWERGLGIEKSNTLPSSECPCGWAWENRQQLTIPDLVQETRFASALGVLRERGIRSYTVALMFTPKGCYGALGIGYGETVPDARPTADVLQRAARLMALAVENREVLRESEKQQGRLQSLVAISRELASTLDVEQLIPLVFANVREITNYDFAGLALLEADGRSLRLRAVDPPTGVGGREDQRIPLPAAISAQAIATRSITFHDRGEMERFNSFAMKELRDAEVESLCCVPLLMGNRAMGSLVLATAAKSAFSQEDGEYLQQVASLIAAALHNATAFREVSQVKDRLTQEKKYFENETGGEQRKEEIVGKSSALKRVLDNAAIVAHTDTTVLITGETGTGKERIARAIHLSSPRRDRNFIKLNCAAIPTGLLESELFGHEKGAFTGAVSQKVGRLELADKGTLLLDEIGEIPLELQPKLLRVLQDQEFERLGGTRTIRVDVRLLAASNRDLVRAVEEKHFRSDLFYRLHVFPIHLPALRERREDIPLLVRHFVEKCSARLNKKIDFIPDEAVEAMMNWSWPGNIRELENFIERSVILSEGNRLRPPLAELRQEPSRRVFDSEGTLRDRERDHILEILRQTRGLLSGPAGAAARLGLKRTTLQYKLQKLGISRSEYLDG